MRLETAADNSAWQTAALTQTPASLWAHGSDLTEYQVWVCYRVAVRQLNTYFPGRELDPSCSKLRCCRREKETMEHIFWTCSCAQACWQKVICHWTSERWYLGHLQGFVQYSASRQPVALSKVVVDRIEREHPDEEHAYATVWARLWRILSSVYITSLWIQRNRVLCPKEGA